MTGDILEHKLNHLSEQDRKLLLYKLKDMVSHTNISTKADKAKRVVAYVKSGPNFDQSAISTFLKERLPDYMVPSAIHILDEIPKLPNGKVDKKRLKSLNEETVPKKISTTENKATDSSITEEQLTKIWEEVLNITPIYKDDNFFEIGGDSILSIQIIAKTRKLGMELTANQLFEYQTISELSQYLQKNSIAKKEETLNQKDLNFLVPLRKEGSKNPLFCVHSGGGHVFFYNLLSKYLKPDRPIYAVEPYGLYDEDDMHKSVEDMTKDYLEAIKKIQPNGPYNILVYCFSTSVGNEMSLLLDKTNEKINLIVVDTMASAWGGTGDVAAESRIIFFIKRFIKTPIKTIHTFFKARLYLFEQWKMKRFGKAHQKEIAKIKAHLGKISLNYKFKPHNGKVSLIILHSRDEETRHYVIDSWKKLAKGGVDLFYSKGNHTTLFQEPDIKFISEQIDLTIKD